MSLRVMPQKKVIIRLGEIEKIAKMQSTIAEAASFFNISPSTFRKLLKKDPRAQRAWERGKDNGKLSLRRKQFRLATTNSQMAIFLGKQYLEQDEKTISEVNATINSVDVSRLTTEEKKQFLGFIRKTSREKL